ncbi:MAG: hypothetical protein AB7P08_19150 [Burkholderiales bacterium]
MKADRAGRVADGLRPDGAPSACQVQWVEVERLRTSFAALRQGRIGLARAGELEELPLRVVSVHGAAPLELEVLDGFKRLERWRGQGARVVPVVVEGALLPRDAKRLLLVVNAPPRTLSVMDEARVVASLREDDGLGPKTIAGLLGRKPHWVRRRLAMAAGLAPVAERKVDAGQVGPTLAYALVGLGTADQEAVLAAVERHRLGARQALVLVSALRAAGDARERARLLEAPRALFAPEASVLGGAAARIEERLRRAQEVLTELEQLELPPDLSEAERRRLQARCHRVSEQIQNLARRATGIAGLDHSLPREENVNERADQPEPEQLAVGGRGGRHAAALPGAPTRSDADPERGARPDRDRPHRGERGGEGADPAPAPGGERGDALDRGRGGPQPEDRPARAARGGPAPRELELRLAREAREAG